VLWGRDVEGNQNRGVNFASAALGGNSGVETGVEMSNVLLPTQFKFVYT
jgi:hypothetical protein